jgi:ATP-binding cassette, subfamily B (MDR/TAP), member 1
MFTAMFTLMFGVFSFVHAMQGVQDKDKVVECARKMYAMITTPSPIDPLAPSQKDKRFISEGSLRGKIEFRNVWFRYPSRPGQWVFKGLNLTVHPNEIVAVVGESGAGKSTFINLVMRFYDPERGQVLVDDIDVKEYQIAALRKQMGLVMQEPTLFNYPVKDNIMYGTVTASNEDIRNAAQVANAIEFIET